MASTLTIVTRVRIADGPGGANHLRAALAVVHGNRLSPSSRPPSSASNVSMPSPSRSVSSHPPSSPVPPASYGVAFHRVKGLHFGRFAVVDEEESKPAWGQKKLLPAALVLSLVFDGTKVECVEQLIEAARRELDILYASCEGYPGPKADAATVRDYLFSHDVVPFVFCQGAQGATVSAVHRTAALHEELRLKLDARLKSGTAETALSLARDLRPHPPVIPAVDLPLLLPDLSQHALRLRMLAWIAVLASPLAVLMLFTGLTTWKLGASESASMATSFAPMVVALLFLLGAEALDVRRSSPEPRPRPRDFSRVRIGEDVSVQNALSHCVVVKPGFHRWLTLRAVFWAIRQRVAIFDRYTGSLAGIASIHFARWVPLDGGARLLFLSDYDGSWESCLAEFVDRAPWGLSAIWSNTLDFPETWLLVFKGAKNEERLKTWAREKQIETPLWYSAYPDRTVANIHNDLRMAQLLAQDKPAPADPAWLGLL